MVKTIVCLVVIIPMVVMSGQMDGMEQGKIKYYTSGHQNVFELFPLNP